MIFMRAIIIRTIIGRIIKWSSVQLYTSMYLLWHLSYRHMIGIVYCSYLMYNTYHQCNEQHLIIDYVIQITRISFPTVSNETITQNSIFCLHFLFHYFLWWSKANGSCIIWLTDRTFLFSICCVRSRRVLMSLLMPYLSGSINHFYTTIIQALKHASYRVHPWLHCLLRAMH